MSRPGGFLSVMADRAPSIDDLDYFPTPPWAARAGAALIMEIDFHRGGSVWEPACGGGHMVHGLKDYWQDVRASDIHAYSPGIEVRDFLEADLSPWPCDWIVTNPPFVKGEAFVRMAWHRARRGVAMLLRLSFLEGAARYKLLYEDCPLFAVAPFAERVPMVKGRWDPHASSATAYAWFIWRKPEIGGGLEPPRLIPIPPGAKKRFSKPSDLDLFVTGAPNLFDPK